MGADGQDGHIARKDAAPGQSHQSRVHTDTGVLYHRNAVRLQLPGDSPANPSGIAAAGFCTASHQREPAPGHAIPEQSLPGGHQHLQTRSATADHHHLQGPTAGKRQHLRPEMHEPVDGPQHEGMLCGPRHHLLQAQAVDALSATALGGAELLNPLDGGPHARFLAYRSPDAARWQKALLDRNVITDVRGDRLRIGFGLYHDRSDITELLRRVAALS